MATQQWWVIAFTSYGNPPSYEYVEGTRAQAEAKAKLAVEVSTSPAITGPFPTKAAAQASVAAGKAHTPSPGDTGPHIPSLGNPLQAIGNFFNDLTQRNTWLRVAKIVAGFVLVVVGVLHLVHAGNIVTAAARTVPV